LIFSCIALPEISAIFSRKGTNFSGKIRIENAVAATSASVCRVVIEDLNYNLKYYSVKA